MTFDAIALNRSNCAGMSRVLVSYSALFDSERVLVGAGRGWSRHVATGRS
jgi:hypothetical protein